MTVVVAIVTVIVTASLGACATIQINSAVRFAGVLAGVVPAVRTRLVVKRGALTRNVNHWIGLDPILERQPIRIRVGRVGLLARRADVVVALPPPSVARRVVDLFVRYPDTATVLVAIVLENVNRNLRAVRPSPRPRLLDGPEADAVTILVAP